MPGGGAIVVQLFWRFLPPGLLKSSTHVLDGTAHRAYIKHRPQRAQDTQSGLGRTHFHGEASEMWARGP